MTEQQKCYIVGAGPSFTIDRLVDKNRVIIACDQVTHFVDEYMQVDYSVTLEDDFTYTPNCYSGKFINKTPKVIISHRTSPRTEQFLHDNWFNYERFVNELMGITGNVGLMAWLFAWQRLGMKDITLVGFDHLYKPFNLVWEMNREVFNEMIFDYCPKDIVTHLDYFEEAGFFIEEFWPRPKEYPGFSDIRKYIQYRQKRNNEILGGPYGHPF